MHCKPFYTTQSSSWSLLTTTHRFQHWIFNPQSAHIFISHFLITPSEHLIQIRTQIRLWYFILLNKTLWPCWWYHTKIWKCICTFEKILNWENYKFEFYVRHKKEAFQKIFVFFGQVLCVGDVSNVNQIFVYCKCFR